MPRVHTVTKSNRGKPVNCAKCGKPITEGQTFYRWAIKSSYGGTTYRQHTECGYPRPTQLSRRKMAQVEEAVQDASTAIGQWSPELPSDNPDVMDVDEIRAALQSVADVARSVGEEYSDGFNNMPDGLQQGSTGQAMEEIARELEGWADALENWDPQVDAPDWPDPAQGDEGDADANDAETDDIRQDALDSWADDIRDEAETAMADMPEFQG